MTAAGQDQALPGQGSESARDQTAELQQELARLRQENEDLQIALLTTTEHGDLIEAQLYQTNQQLQAEVAERKQVQAVLQEIFEKVSQDKADLEIMLEATAQHGDTVEYQLYTQAVETMRQSEALFRAIAESTPILMILSQAPDGIITYANSISIQRLMPEEESLVGRRLGEFLPDPKDDEQLQQRLQTSGYVRDYEVQLRNHQGCNLWVSASIHPLVLNGQQILLTTLYDISDRKQAELLLQDSEDKLRQQAQELELRVEQRTRDLAQAEAKYRGIFEHAAQGIFQITAEGRYLQVNPALVRILGYDSTADLKENLTDARRQLYVESHRWHELMAYLKRYDTLSDFESEVYRKNGSTIWISESIRPVRDPQGKLLYYEGSVWNITQRKQTEAALRQERQTSERLLLNVLPQLIAQRLKRGQKNIADYYDNVTVLFADIVSFTSLSSRIDPKSMVALLNDIFSTFDQLADYYRLEKIKTIGDAYMVAGGLPKPQIDAISAIADMALAMREAMDPFQIDGQPIRLRVGIHTGPVIAGVIGTRKFTYDLWGDTVNVANRMESQGESDRIQVTEAVYQRLEQRYNFEPRGPIEIKGKGHIQTYWLLSHKSD
ncbi:adenylate/guanylate cyclase domain-containing protein [Leptolyngbya sp. PCC 6406]|uniref:adenylate/guanylate cyclase domain-containing protein n=1 Tax=Leptolyngbya sp. PCC 6406 TaxID=1173264 RepID=UPI0002AC98B3|nr:adenylate/guanylate cyclase domain-containing protein [Leptolyngbya sp. PCC 6406]